MNTVDNLRVETVLAYGAFDSETATIANGASKSDVIDVRGFGSLALMLPAAWTAADIGFLHSNDPADATPQDLQDGLGNRLKLSVAGDQTIAVPASVERAIAAAQYVWLESIDTATEVAVAQGAERVITVLLGG